MLVANLVNLNKKSGFSPQDTAAVCSFSNQLARPALVTLLISEAGF